MICNLNNKIKNSEESKVAHDDAKSEDLNEQRIELDKGYDLSKCKHQIDIINFNWKSWVLLILLNHISCF